MFSSLKWSHFLNSLKEKMKPVVQEVRCQEVAAALAAGEVVELVVEGHLNKHNSFDYYIK